MMNGEDTVWITLVTVGKMWDSKDPSTGIQFIITYVQPLPYRILLIDFIILIFGFTYHLFNLMILSLNSSLSHVNPNIIKGNIIISKDLQVIFMW